MSTNLKSLWKNSKWNSRQDKPARDRPFNLKGGLWFFVSFRNLFSDNTSVRIFFFVAQSANFFIQYSTLLYDKNSESDYFFFPPPKSEYFSSNIGNQNIFLEKKHNPPSPLQVKWAFPNLSTKSSTIKERPNLTSDITSDLWTD